MRLAGVGVLVTLVGCASQPLDIDVVVSKDRGIAAYLNGSDYTDSGNLVDGIYQFPRIGTCVGTGDVISDRPSCVERAVFVGAGFEREIQTSFIGISSPPDPLPADFALEIEGCGDTVHIPLGDYGNAMPVVDVQSAGDNVHAAWTSDQPWDSALVVFAMEHTASICHTADSELSFEQPVQRMSVTLFESPDVTHASWGEARVWRGATATLDVPMP